MCYYQLLPVITSIVSADDAKRATEYHLRFYNVSYERFLKPSLSFQVNVVYLSQLNYDNGYNQGTGVGQSFGDYESKNEHSTVYVRPNMRWFFNYKKERFRGLYLNGGINVGYHKASSSYYSVNGNEK